ncbi:hypothetical protein ACFLYB_01485 [Chloroflexota bacterium]
MQDRELRIGRIPITAELLLYTLLAISVISGVVVNVLKAAINISSFPELFIYGLISLLLGIGIIAIIWEVVKRRRRVGGAIFLAIAIYMLWGLLYEYNHENGSLYDYPYLMAPVLVLAVSWIVSGVIIILRGKSFLSAKGS